MIALARVNSFRPSSPWIRPKPESPTPPNGRDGTDAKAMTEFMLVMPERMRSAMEMPRALERVKTAPARP